MTERPDGSRRERAWQCWQDVLAGILKAVSVGFVPIAESLLFKSVEESAKILAGVALLMSLNGIFVELSLCPIGSNPDALQVRKFTLSQTYSTETLPGKGHLLFAVYLSLARAKPKGLSIMNPSEILGKLGLAEGAAPESCGGTD